MEINKKNEQDLKIYFETLNYFRYSKHTVNIYCHYLTEFLNYTDKYSQHIVASDFDEYLKQYKFTSTSQQNQVISAIKKYYTDVLKKKYNKVNFKRPRKEKKLPQVIDNGFLVETISNVKNKKHKAIIAIGYSCGLRVSEVINLKISDIDSKRMIINIHNAKGRKDRIVKLSDGLLTILKDYYKEYHPNLYLFNGQFGDKYSTTSCNKIVKKYLGESYHFHLLRHSSFTSLMESGVDIRIIQKLAGHNSIKTTEIYTHVSVDTIKNIPELI